MALVKSTHYYFHPFPYLDKRLRDDEQLVTIAVNQDVMLMHYVSGRLKSNEAFKAKLLKSNSYFPNRLLQIEDTPWYLIL